MSLPKIYLYISTYVIPLQLWLYYTFPNVRCFLLPPIITVLLIGCLEALLSPFSWPFILIGLLVHLIVLYPVATLPSLKCPAKLRPLQQFLIDATLLFLAIIVILIFPVWQYYIDKTRMIILYTLLSASTILITRNNY